MKDVGQVHDGWQVQQNIVRKDGRRSVLLSIIKNGNASTLDVVNGVREALKTSRAAAPPGLEITEQQVANYKFDFIARLRSLIRDQELSEEVFPELYENDGK